MTLEVRWLGKVSYRDALDLQQQQIAARRAGTASDVVLLLEHPAVVTQGRSTQPENLLATPAELAERGIELFETARGGDVTYHAPGQLVGYPIIDLAARGECDVHSFLRRLEESLIEAIAELGIEGERVEGKTGVFARRQLHGERERKIASIGIGLRRWITWHGFALNVNLDLSGFGVIVPCGLEGVDMTSVEAELVRAGRPVPADLAARARAAVERALATRFG